jgi:hypothetical protein
MRLTKVNHSKPRELRQAKGADKPEPKGKRPGREVFVSSFADGASSGYRWSLSHPNEGHFAERGKPVSLPNGKASRKVSR